MKIRSQSIAFVIALFAALGLVSTFSIRAEAQPVGGMTKKKAPPKKTEKAETNEKGFTVGPDAMTSYVIDESNSKNEVSFTSKTAAEKITGKSSKVAGTFSINPRKIESASGKFSVAWKDLDTGKPMMNTHMMASPWVDAKANPEIVFTVTGIELGKPGAKPAAGKNQSLKAKLMGKMSINGKDKDLKVNTTLVYLESKGGVKEGLGIRAAFKVDLEDYGIKGKGVGEKVAKQEEIKVSLFLIPGSADKGKGDDKVSAK
jgi:polyisoprenoid-binding protein YceI